MFFFKKSNIFEQKKICGEKRRRKKCYPLSFPILGLRDSTRALQCTPSQNLGGRVPWAWRTEDGRRIEGGGQKSLCLILDIWTLRGSVPFFTWSYRWGHNMHLYNSPEPAPAPVLFTWICTCTVHLNLHLYLYSSHEPAPVLFAWASTCICTLNVYSSPEHALAPILFTWTCIGTYTVHLNMHLQMYSSPEPAPVLFFWTYICPCIVHLNLHLHLYSSPESAPVLFCWYITHWTCPGNVSPTALCKRNTSCRHTGIKCFVDMLI